jgi:hypothetical protein
MLWILLVGSFFMSRNADAVWFYGGQTTKQLQEQVANVEPNKESRKAINRTLDETQSQASRWQAVRLEFSKDVLATLARHDASAADFQSLEARADAISAASRQAFLDLRFSLRGQLSDRQWQRLFGSKNP